MILLYNTLTRKKEAFSPLSKKVVKIYTCGPTVYWFAHIGNLRTYIFEDILKRVLEHNSFKIKHVMNITDVGHLTSDADTGEDKVEKTAKREKKSARKIARFYEKAFKNDLKLLNIKKPDLWLRATETIEDQINLIKILEKNSFTYKILDGIYFDSSKLKTYGHLWPQKFKIKAEARIKMTLGKKSPTDFALWKFTPSGVKRQMEWNSPWGRGFPGWHTECVVMSKKSLGIPFDIHCGGIDHVLIHHVNELAQAEAAYGKILANFWLHGEFLTVEGRKMAKSEKNIFTLADLIERKFNPLAFRYFCLGAHYRSKLNFSWKALRASQITLNKLYQSTAEILSKQKNIYSADNLLNHPYKKRFLEFVNDDLNILKAIALMWKLIKDKNITSETKYNLLVDFDKVFGFNLENIKEAKIPQTIKKLIRAREEYRLKKKWNLADKIREKIYKLGYIVSDTKGGPEVKPILEY